MEDNNCPHVFDELDAQFTKHETYLWLFCRDCRQIRKETFSVNPRECIEVEILKEGKIV